MKIGLIDVDGHNFPNLPLMKLSSFYKNRGDIVEWYAANKHYDIIYKSKIFDFTPDIFFEPKADIVIKGGTGYSTIKFLPYCVEHEVPDYNLYPQFKNTAYGFLTRGCPRQCKFCIVPQKEGRQSKYVADLNEFYTGQKLIKLLDPNLLACMEREKLLYQLIASGAYVDFTQGIDIRFIDKDLIFLLNKIKIDIIHFAWDNPNEDLIKYFEFFDKHTRIKDSRRRSVYILTNFNSTHEQDLMRIYILQKMKYDPYVMIYDKQNAPQVTRRLQRWVNNRRLFRTCKTFDKYDESRRV